MPTVPARNLDRKRLAVIVGTLICGVVKIARLCHSRTGKGEGRTQIYIFGSLRTSTRFPSIWLFESMLVEIFPRGRSYVRICFRSISVYLSARMYTLRKLLSALLP